jgi:hypothetical protein
LFEVLDSSVDAHEAPPACVPTGDTPPATRGQILRLQQAMLPHACEMFPHVDHFAPGLYLREFRMPPNSLVVGKTHLHAHPMLVTKGRAVVVSEFGREEVEAGYISISQPGAKRVVLALEETVFVTVHANPDDCRDMDVIETRTIRPEDPAEIEAALRELLR